MNEVITPELLGFPEGTQHIIYGWDYEDGVYNEAGLVEIVKIADNHLLRVVAHEPITDTESGDFYSPGTQFTAYNTRDEDDRRVLTFIPIPPADDDDEGGTFSSSLPDEYHQFRDAPDDEVLPI